MAWKQYLPLGKAVSLVYELKDRVKEKAIQLRDNSAVREVKLQNVLNFSDFLANSFDALESYKLAGIDVFAKEQFNDNTFDIIAEIDGAKAGIQSIIDWLVANFPATSGWLRLYQIGPDGRSITNTISTANTAGLRVELNSLIAVL